MEKMEAENDRFELILTHFDGKTEWYIPKSAVIVQPMIKRNYEKLKKWIEAGDNIEYGIDLHGQLWIQNRTKIEAYKNRKKKT